MIVWNCLPLIFKTKIFNFPGVKAALIDRLKEALDLEQGQAGKFGSLKVLNKCFGWHENLQRNFT